MLWLLNAAVIAVSFAFGCGVVCTQVRFIRQSLIRDVEKIEQRLRSLEERSGRRLDIAGADHMLIEYRIMKLEETLRRLDG